VNFEHPTMQVTTKPIVSDSDAPATRAESDDKEARNEVGENEQVSDYRDDQLEASTAEELDVVIFRFAQFASILHVKSQTAIVLLLGVFTTFSCRDILWGR